MSERYYSNNPRVVQAAELALEAWRANRPIGMAPRTMLDLGRLASLCDHFAGVYALDGDAVRRQAARLIGRESLV